MPRFFRSRARQDPAAAAKPPPTTKPTRFFGNPSSRRAKFPRAAPTPPDSSAGSTDDAAPPARPAKLPRSHTLFRRADGGGGGARGVPVLPRSRSLVARRAPATAAETAAAVDKANEQTAALDAEAELAARAASETDVRVHAEGRQEKDLLPPGTSDEEEAASAVGAGAGGDLRADARSRRLGVPAVPPPPPPPPPPPKHLAVRRPVAPPAVQPDDPATRARVLAEAHERAAARKREEQDRMMDEADEEADEEVVEEEVVDDDLVEDAVARRPMSAGGGGDDLPSLSMHTSDTVADVDMERAAGGPPPFTGAAIAPERAPPPALPVGPVSAADLAAASRRRIAALSAGRTPAASPFASSAPRGPAREVFEPAAAEGAPVFAAVRLAPAAPRHQQAIPRSASAAPWCGGAALLGSAAPPAWNADDEAAPPPASRRPDSAAIPRSASLFQPSGRAASGRLTHHLPYLHRHHSSGTDDYAYPTTTAAHGHRMSGVAMAPPHLAMRTSKTFSPSSSPFEVDDPAPSSLVSPTPTGWSTRPASPPKPAVVDPRKLREEAKIREAREMTHKLSPDDPNYRRRRRTAAVNLVDAFKEELPPAELAPVARIPRSESKRGGGGFGGGPSFRRNRSRKSTAV